MLLRELNLAAEERSAFLECGRPNAVLAAIRTDAGFSAAEEDKVAAFGVASVDHGFTSLLLRTVYHRESPIKLPFLQEHREVWYTDSTNHKKFVWEYQNGGTKTQSVTSIILPAVLCTALWGSAAPCVKRGYELFAVSADAPFSQLIFAGWRFALAGILVLLVTRLKGHRIVPKRDEIKPILAISLFQSMLQYVCYYIGLSGTTGTKGSVLSGTQTFFALLLAHCLLPNDKLNRRKTLGCICGFAGVLALGLGGLNGFNLTGDGLVLLSAVSAGAGALVSRIYTPGRDPMLLTGWQLLIGGCFLLGVGTMGGGALGRVTLGGVLLLGYMIVLSAAAFTIWTALLGKFPVGKVSLFGFLIPVFGTLFSALVLGENIFTARNLAALVLVSGGIAVANSASTKK